MEYSFISSAFKLNSYCMDEIIDGFCMPQSIKMANIYIFAPCVATSNGLALYYGQDNTTLTSLLIKHSTTNSFPFCIYFFRDETINIDFAVYKDRRVNMFG